MATAPQEVRFAEVEFETQHARVQVVLDLDGGTKRDIATGIGALDHLLGEFCFFAGVDLGLTAEGNLHVDDHHLVESIGGALGTAFREALMDTGPIERIGSAHGVSGDALVLCAVDVDRVGSCTIQCPLQRDRLGLLATESIAEFLRMFGSKSGMTLHVHHVAGTHSLRLAESIFRGFGLAVQAAIQRNDRHRPVRTNGGLSHR